MTIRSIFMTAVLTFGCCILGSAQNQGAQTPADAPSATPTSTAPASVTPPSVPAKGDKDKDKMEAAATSMPSATAISVATVAWATGIAWRNRLRWASNFPNKSSRNQS